MKITETVKIESELLNDFIGSLPNGVGFELNDKAKEFLGEKYAKAYSLGWRGRLKYFDNSKPDKVILIEV